MPSYTKAHCLLLCAFRASCVRAVDSAFRSATFGRPNEQPFRTLLLCRRHRSTPQWPRLLCLYSCMMRMAIQPSVVTQLQYAHRSLAYQT